jgi:hypothetical protein
MMKKVLVVPLTLWGCLIPGAAMAQEGFKVIDSIAGTSLKFILSALPELSRYGYSFKLDEYRVIVVTTGGASRGYFPTLEHSPWSRGKYARQTSVRS